MRDNARTDFRAQNMGFIFQTFNLLPVLTVVENVELPALVAGVKPGQARKRALHWVEALGLADQTGKRPAEISGGQQQRVAIARSLVNNPAIIWCDEPTGNLDSENQKQVMDVLCGLNKDKGQTFVLVTHSEEVGERADRIVHMRDGLIEQDCGVRLHRRPGLRGLAAYHLSAGAPGIEGLPGGGIAVRVADPGYR